MTRSARWWLGALGLAVGSCGGATGGTGTVTPPGYESPCSEDEDCSAGFICVDSGDGDAALVCRKPCDRDEPLHTQCPPAWCAECVAVEDGRPTCRIAGCS